MALDTRGEISEIGGRAATDYQLANADDIATGVEEPVDDVSAFTLYLEVHGAVNVKIEFSPDGGSSWYEPRNESPVEFSGENTEVVHVDYNANHVRLTGSDSTPVSAQIREVV